MKIDSNSKVKYNISVLEFLEAKNCLKKCRKINPIYAINKIKNYSAFKSAFNVYKKTWNVRNFQYCIRLIKKLSNKIS